MNQNFADLSVLLTSGRDWARPVALDDGRTCSWLEFVEKIQGLCAEFSADPASEWILYCQNSLAFAMGFMALAQTGKTIILPHNIQEGTLREMGVTDTKILTDRPVKNSPYTMISLSLDSISRIPYKLKTLDSENTHIQIYTSGSTAKPKMVTKRLHQLEAEVHELEKVWGAELGDSAFFSTVVNQHIYGLLFRVLWPLCRGSIFSAQLLTIPEELHPIRDEQNQAVLISSPAFLKRMQLLDSRDSLAGAFKVFSSGGALAKDTADAMNGIFGCYPQEVLGSTETGGVAYRTQADGNLAWTPFDVVETKVDDAGQLLIRSPYTDIEGFLPMGDAVEFIAESSRFLLKGRVDKIVKIEEKRVSLSEIEARLIEHDYVEQAAAVAVSGKRQMIGVALVLSGAGQKNFADAKKKDINDFFREHLLQYFERVVLPRRWQYVDSLPMNAQGKVTAEDLKSLFSD